MFNKQFSYRAVSRSICMVMAVFVVGSALALGHIGLQSLANNGKDVFQNMSV